MGSNLLDRVHNGDAGAVVLWYSSHCPDYGRDNEDAAMINKYKSRAILASMYVFLGVVMAFMSGMLLSHELLATTLIYAIGAVVAMVAGLMHMLNFGRMEIAQRFLDIYSRYDQESNGNGKEQEDPKQGTLF